MNLREDTLYGLVWRIGIVLWIAIILVRIR